MSLPWLEPGADGERFSSARRAAKPRPIAWPGFYVPKSNKKQADWTPKSECARLDLPADSFSRLKKPCRAISRSSSGFTATKPVPKWEKEEGDHARRDVGPSSTASSRAQTDRRGDYSMSRTSVDQSRHDKLASQTRLQSLELGSSRGRWPANCRIGDKACVYFRHNVLRMATDDHAPRRPIRRSVLERSSATDQHRCSEARPPDERALLTIVREDAGGT